MRIRTCVLEVGCVLLLFLSAGTPKTSLSEGYHPGDLAPRIESLGVDRGINYLNRSGRYTLLNFWAAYDAESRAKNVLLWNYVSKMDSNRIEMYSVSMDERASVFTETVKMDNLDLSNQFNERKGKESPLYKAFGLHKGLGSFLIDGNGVIVATHVDPQQISSLLN